MEDKQLSTALAGQLQYQAFGVDSLRPVQRRRVRTHRQRQVHQCLGGLSVVVEAESSPVVQPATERDDLLSFTKPVESLLQTAGHSDGVGAGADRLVPRPDAGRWLAARG